MKTSVEEVQAFWNANPCNSDLSHSEERVRYFQEISDRRYGYEWHIPIVGKFYTFRGKDVLEIGCGIATDGFEFAKSGANYVGVDLTPRAVEFAQERFNLLRMPGRFEIVNAEEKLPFADNTFDHVYSFGVIHHSPTPEKIVREIRRVLKKGGTFTVMLYNRSSINYYLEIMFLRRLFRWLLLPKFMPGLIARLTGFDRWKLEGHRRILRERKSLSKQEWISMNTDGPFCPLARVYSRNQAAALFQDFTNVRQEVWWLNVDHWPFVRRAIPNSITRRIGRRLGWHRIIYGRKS